MSVALVLVMVVLSIADITDTYILVHSLRLSFAQLSTVVLSRPRPNKLTYS